MSTPARSQLISVSADYFDCEQAFLPIVASRSTEGLGMAVSYVYCVTEPVMWCLHLRSSIMEKGENIRAHRWCPATTENRKIKYQEINPIVFRRLLNHNFTNFSNPYMFINQYLSLFSFQHEYQVIDYRPNSSSTVTPSVDNIYYIFRLRR